jgi:hypothetical protein
LRERGLLTAVIERAPPAARDLLIEPPLVSEWVSGEAQNAVLDAVHAVGGDALVREMIRSSIRTGVLRLLEPVLHGFARVFGRSPDVVLSRIESMRKNVVRGVSFAYEPLSSNAGLIVIRSLGDPLGACSALAWASSAEVLCELMGAGRASATAETSADRMSARVKVSW